MLTQGKAEMRFLEGYLHYIYTTHGLFQLKIETLNLLL